MMFSFFHNKSIFITGHTGFKGAWLTRILQLAGAKVTGYSLAFENGAAYERIVDIHAIESYTADIRDFANLREAFDVARPEIVFHLAAQPLVFDAFARPSYTFDVNVQGTTNLLECIRFSDTVKSTVIITTDKVYRNNEWVYGYRENDILGDFEPYAASKACAEIAAASYYETFLRKKGIALSTARAGNVIGGGDISANRIIPDCIRAAKKHEPIVVRNKFSIRPYQHVLEPLFAYLMIAQEQLINNEYSGQYNIGPREDGCVRTDELVKIFCSIWGDSQTFMEKSVIGAVHESGRLMLDCSKIRQTFDWHPMWNITQAIEKTIEWEKSDKKQEMTDKQIKEYGLQWTH